MKTPYQRLNRDVAVMVYGDTSMLPKGALVKVIKPEYLPKGHPMRERRLGSTVPAYSQLGLVLIDESALEWLD